MVPITKAQPVIVNATATTTSAPIQVTAFKALSLFVKRADHSAGSSAFSVEVSCNYDSKTGSGDWVAYNKLISNATNTNVQDLTRVSSISLSANGTGFVTFDNTDAFTHVRVTVTETTDGTHSAWLVYKA